MDFAGYRYISMLMVLAEIAVLLLTYKRNPKLAIYAVLLSIVLKGQYLWVGRAIYAWQIAALFGLAYLAAKPTQEAIQIAGQALKRFRSTMLLYFIYTLAISIPMWLMFHAEGLGNAGTQVSGSRALTQTVYFLFVIGLYGLGTWTGRYLTTVDLLRAIILIAVIAAYGAILQWLLFRFADINIFPIIGSDDTVRSAYILDLAFRATSFVGEPKHLGLLMSIGLISIFLMRIFRFSIGNKYAFHKAIAMSVSLLMSLSTTGIVLTVIGIGSLAIIYFRRLRTTDLIATGLVALLLVTQLMGTSGGYSTALERQISKTDFEVQDESVRQGLLANPGLILTGTGLGNIHLIAVKYLPTNFPLFRDRGYKANSGLFFVMGDSGFIGLFLLFLGPIFAISSTVQMRGRLGIAQHKEALSAVALLLASLLGFMLRYDVAYFLFAGFVFTRLTFLHSQTLVLNSGLGIPMLGEGHRRWAEMR